MRRHDVDPIPFWRRIWCRVVHQRHHATRPGYHSWWVGCSKCRREWLELD